MSRPTRPQPVSQIGFLPGIVVNDELAAYWLRQVTLRLRREVCWLWHERGLLRGSEPTRACLPPFSDSLVEALDLARFDAERHAFFRDDETAQLLSERIAADPPDLRHVPAAPRGSFSDLVRRLELDSAACFVLALALAQAVDGAIGSVFAACLNEPGKRSANLALAQRLWDEPQAVLGHIDPSTSLARHGLLSPIPSSWESPLTVPALVTRQLLMPDVDPPQALSPLERDPAAARQIPDPTLVAARLKARVGEGGLVLVPVTGPAGASLGAAAAEIAHEMGWDIVRPASGVRGAELGPLLTVAWLRGAAVFLPADQLIDPHPEARRELPIEHGSLPLLIFVGGEDPAFARHLPSAVTLPMITLRPLEHAERLERWIAGLPAAESDPRMRDMLADCARRYRYESMTIDRVCSALRALDGRMRPEDLHTACRADADLGDLAQRVPPRFARDELMLPPRQSGQIDALIQAVRSLTTVHYEWGTARAWNEAGLSVLFTGPPGTGKTMAAEVIARAVAMPLFRIDISQVVSKYIGETEKNLRRLFDAADASDVILFFDEADALFGKRTEVKDSHDRYANLEISYLLERMERFKGMAILATNRKRDLDEAFLRRLRYVIDFPLPGVEERLRIWQMAVPDGVDVGDLDLAFLAERLPFAGGHIRSIVLNACLQSARPGARRALSMRTMVRAARDEMEKLGRAISRDPFGAYARHLDG